MSYRLEATSLAKIDGKNNNDDDNDNEKVEEEDDENDNDDDDDNRMACIDRNVAVAVVRPDGRDALNATDGQSCHASNATARTHRTREGHATTRSTRTSSSTAAATCLMIGRCCTVGVRPSVCLHDPDGCLSP